MAVIKTIIRVPTQDVQYWIPGDFTVQQIQSMYAAQIEGLSGMVGSEVLTDTVGGQERTVTFLPRQGQKG